jgi:DNA-binding SARP family transcriptional activator
MPRRKPNPESDADSSSRARLRGFLVKVRKFLSDAHRAVTSERSSLRGDAKEGLSVLWKDADAKLQGVIRSQEIGNPKWRRDSLQDAGMFGEELGAKDKIFGFILEEKRFLAALRFLASVFGSLSKAFPALSAVKEFIDAVLCVRDWLPGDPEFTTLGDLR